MPKGFVKRGAADANRCRKYLAGAAAGTGPTARKYYSEQNQQRILGTTKWIKLGDVHVSSTSILLDWR